ncbi:hypothetical protein FKM82_003875 [Ascaphus truei]
MKGEMLIQLDGSAVLPNEMYHLFSTIVKNRFLSNSCKLVLFKCLEFCFLSTYLGLPMNFVYTVYLLNLLSLNQHKEIIYFNHVCRCVIVIYSQLK